jgi:hypothetical protein
VIPGVSGAIVGYTIRLERASPVLLEEWKAAVTAREDLRLQKSRASITNPKTGEVIELGFAEGDTEIRIGAAWQPCFRWRASGTAVFDAPGDFEDRRSAVRSAAHGLAESLGCRVVGEDGEEYE